MGNAMAYVAPTQDAFRAIADPNRRRMLDAMAEGERTVRELTDLLAVSQPTVSQHIQVLKVAGLLDERRAGRNTFYRMRPEALAEVGDWLDKYRAFWADRLDRLEMHLRKTSN